MEFTFVREYCGPRKQHINTIDTLLLSKYCDSLQISFTITVRDELIQVAKFIFWIWKREREREREFLL